MINTVAQSSLFRGLAKPLRQSAGALLVLGVLQSACAATDGDDIRSGSDRVFKGSVTLTAPDYKITTVATDLNHPWSIAFLDENRQLVTERSGNLRLVTDGKVGAPVEGVPQSLVARQGGLFDVVLHPDFSSNGWIYLSYAYGETKANATRLIRGQLEGNTLANVEVLFTASPLKDTTAHYGGRFCFLPDRTLLLSIGDGYDYREHAQKLDSHLGKIVRLNANGSVPADNPFVDAADALPEIWSYGHRNAQAIVLDTQAMRIYSNEHGPKGGDEINWIGGGQNYGWPIATYGIDYSGAKISPYTEHIGTTQPLLHWTPSIAPGGMASVQSDLFPDMNGDLLVAALKEREVRRVRIEEDKVVAEQRLFGEIGERIRDVRIAPDGSIFLLTDSPAGKILRITPK